MLMSLLSNEELSSRVDSENTIKFFRSHIVDVPKILQPTVRHYDIDMPIMIRGLFE
jgi:hypothetical protein